MSGVDLYAKIEHLFDFEDTMEYLWDKYIQELKKQNIKTVLDIGCGSGGFMLKAKQAGFEVVGIDISKEMVNIAKQKNLNVYHKELCEVDEKFDACVAIFDVINYMDKSYLKNFFECVGNVLKKDGCFLFDINSLHGFRDVAQGSMVVDDGEIFGVLDSVFDEDVMNTKITVFSKTSSSYTREDSQITQYLHTTKEIQELSKLTLKDNIDIHLYSDEADKQLLIFANQ